MYGESILQGSSVPDENELENLLHDDIIVCGPRTVYISVTLPYWSPITSGLSEVQYELTILRTVPDNIDSICESEQLRAFIFVYILQPIALSISIIGCLVFSILGIYTRYKYKYTSIEIEDESSKEESTFPF